MSHKRPLCCEVERGDIMKKFWYLFIAIVLLIVSGLAYGYHEHSKPKTAQELKPCALRIYRLRMRYPYLL